MILLALKMDIQNLSWNETLLKRKNNKLFPKSIRGILIGKSNCGKTTLLLNLLLREGWLDFDSLQIFGKSLFQPEYKIIKKAFEEGVSKESILRLFENKEEIMNNNVCPYKLLEEVAKEVPQDIKLTDKIQSKFFETGDEVPDPSEISSDRKNLIIFDDLMLEKQNKCESYYIRGRHSNVDCFYLTQNYFKLPRQTIRENANFICLFKQDLKNINHIYHDHVSTDLSKEEFKKLCKECWDKPYGFVVIDLTSDKNNGKYRSQLNNFYFPLS